MSGHVQANDNASRHGKDHQQEGTARITSSPSSWSSWRHTKPCIKAFSTSSRWLTCMYVHRDFYRERWTALAYASHWSPAVVVRFISHASRRCGPNDSSCSWRRVQDLLQYLLGHAGLTKKTASMLCGRFARIQFASSTTSFAPPTLSLSYSRTRVCARSMSATCSHVSSSAVAGDC